MDPAEPAIELIDADIPRTRTASPTAVLRNVDWRIDTGEFWGLGAAPGGGKTDLLCTAAALQRPLKGFHLIFGKDTREMDEQELVISHRKVAMVFDTGRLFAHLTVAENIALPLAYHLGEGRKEVADRVHEILDATQLQEVRDRMPGQIPRSLHQRAGLARSLALAPEVLLIDSPLLGIDPRQGRWWLDFLCQLHRGHPLLGQRPLTLVVSADDFRPWTGIAEKFAIIKDKKVQVIGGREDLRNTKENIVQELLTSAFDAD